MPIRESSINPFNVELIDPNGGIHTLPDVGIVNVGGIAHVGEYRGDLSVLINGTWTIRTSQSSPVLNESGVPVAPVELGSFLVNFPTPSPPGQAIDTEIWIDGVVTDFNAGSIDLQVGKTYVLMLATEVFSSYANYRLLSIPSNDELWSEVVSNGGDNFATTITIDESWLLPTPTKILSAGHDLNANVSTRMINIIPDLGPIASWRGTLEGETVEPGSTHEFGININPARLGQFHKVQLNWLKINTGGQWTTFNLTPGAGYTQVNAPTDPGEYTLMAVIVYDTFPEFERLEGSFTVSDGAPAISPSSFTIPSEVETDSPVNVEVAIPPGSTTEFDISKQD